MRAQNTQIWTASPPIAIDTASEQIGGSARGYGEYAGHSLRPE